MIRLGNKPGGAIAAIAATVLLSLPATRGGENERVRPLDDYPSSDRVWLGSFGAEVEVDPATDLVAARAGDLRWLVEDGERVVGGEAVALMGDRQIRQSASQLEIEKARLPIRRRSAINNHRERKAGIRRQIEELHSRLAQSDLAEAERELIGDALAARLDEERKRLESQIEDLREQLEPDWMEEELRLELEQIDHDLERNRLDHEELVRSMEIIAEHDGLLEIAKEGYVRTSDVVGHVRRTGHAVASVQLADPDVRSERPEKLGVLVTGPDGRRFEGTFTRLQRGPGGRFASTTYYFDLETAADGAAPPPELSGERMATIHRFLPEPARIIRKSPLLFAHAAEINRLGWAGFVNETWPDAEVVFIGPQSIALAKEP